MTENNLKKLDEFYGKNMYNKNDIIEFLDIMTIMQSELGNFESLIGINLIKNSMYNTLNKKQNEGVE